MTTMTTNLPRFIELSEDELIIIGACVGLLYPDEIDEHINRRIAFRRGGKTIANLAAKLKAALESFDE